MVEFPNLLRTFPALVTINKLQVHNNNIVLIKASVASSIPHLNFITLYNNPSFCARGFVTSFKDLIAKYGIICTCAPGYYGQAFCEKTTGDLTRNKVTFETFDSCQISEAYNFTYLPILISIRNFRQTPQPFTRQFVNSKINDALLKYKNSPSNSAQSDPMSSCFSNYSENCPLNYSLFPNLGNVQVDPYNFLQEYSSYTFPGYNGPTIFIPTVKTVFSTEALEELPENYTANVSVIYLGLNNSLPKYAEVFAGPSAFPNLIYYAENSAWPVNMSYLITNGQEVFSCLISCK